MTQSKENEAYILSLQHQHPFSKSQCQLLIDLLLHSKSSSSTTNLRPSLSSFGNQFELSILSACLATISSKSCYDALNWIHSNLSLFPNNVDYDWFYWLANSVSSHQSLSPIINIHNNTTQDEEQHQEWIELFSFLSGRKGNDQLESKVMYTFFSYLYFPISERKKVEEPICVPPKDIILWMYRLALACHVLQNWPRERQDEDDCTSRDQTNTNTSDTATSEETFEQDDKFGISSEHVQELKDIAEYAIQLMSSDEVSSSYPMVNSLIVHHIQQKNKTNADNDMFSYGQEPTLEELESYYSKPCIAIDTFVDWIDTLFPQLSRLLSTFIHLIFFSEWKSTEDINNSDDENVEKSEDESSKQYAWELQYDTERINQLYALGRRQMFQFPQLQRFHLNTSISSARYTMSGLMSGLSYTRTSVSSGLLADIPRCNQGREQAQDEGSTKTICKNLGLKAFGMAGMDERISSGIWHSLYSSDTDGFDFLHFQRALLGYTGPTFILIRPTDTSSLYGSNGISGGGISKDIPSPGLFGIFSANPWKESNGQFYGTSDCCLFRVDPTWNVYQPKQLVEQKKIESIMGNEVGIDSNNSATVPSHQPTPFSSTQTRKDSSNFIYFHSNTQMKTSFVQRTSSKPQGLILGGTSENPRIHLTQSLEQCVASNGGPRDGTFESGPLLTGQWDKFFNVDTIEVYAVGKDDESICTFLKKRMDHHDVLDSTRRQIRNVDKAQFLDDFQSGVYHTGDSNRSLFHHRKDDRIRYDFRADGSGVDPAALYKDRNDRPCDIDD